MMKIRISWLLLVLIFSSHNLSADESIRCEGSLIDIGELISTVLHKCGEPTDTIEYSAHSTTHQRFVISKVTNKRVLVDEFLVQGDFDQPPSERNEDIDDKEMQIALTSISKDSPSDKLNYKKFRIQRKIINTELTNLLSSQYIYWEVTRNEHKIKKLIYNLGPSQFIRILTFKNGVLWKMDFKHYGY